MPQPNKRTMGESYKSALEQKSIDKFRRQAAELRKKHHVIKSEASVTDYQKKISAKEAEIKYLEAEIERQRQKTEGNTSGTIAIVTLVFFAVLVVGGLAIRFRGGSTQEVAGAWGVSLVFLLISLMAQSRALDKEKYLRRGREDLKRAKRELSELKALAHTQKPSH